MTTCSCSRRASGKLPCWPIVVASLPSAFKRVEMRLAVKRPAARDHRLLELAGADQLAFAPQRLGEVEHRGQGIGMRLAERLPALGDSGFQLRARRHG